MDEMMGKLEEIGVILDKFEERILFMEIAIDEIMNMKLSKIDANSWRIYGKRGDKKAIHVDSCSDGRCEVIIGFDPTWKVEKTEDRNKQKGPEFNICGPPELVKEYSSFWKKS